MVRLRSNGLMGDRPNWYRETPSRHLFKEAWVQLYFLSAPDSFESGGAYSLHATEKGAEKFKSPYDWYIKSRESGPKKCYVSPKTLEKILSIRKKAIFVSDKD